MTGRDVLIATIGLVVAAFAVGFRWWVPYAVKKMDNGGVPSGPDEAVDSRRAPEPSTDDGRPGDDPAQTPYHFGWRLMMLWIMPLFVVGTGYMFWAYVASDGEWGGRSSWRVLFLFPLLLIVWIASVLQYRRAKERGETPVPGSYKPPRRRG